ncbi:MAG: hypothetical protein ACNYPE_09320 [Candidatus Azotimanducaceae bacterium WSBS_2022_MAG_OTU7]
MAQSLHGSRLWANLFQYLEASLNKAASPSAYFVSLNIPLVGYLLIGHIFERQVTPFSRAQPNGHLAALWILRHSLFYPDEEYK